MTDIELVIKMPEEMYTQIIDENGIDTMLIPYTDIIKKGTPLPKGHGRLIDADEIKKVYPLMYNDFGMEFNSGIHKVVDNAPTIIEADKSKSEDQE